MAAFAVSFTGCASVGSGKFWRLLPVRLWSLEIKVYSAIVPPWLDLFAWNSIIDEQRVLFSNIRRT